MRTHSAVPLHSFHSFQWELSRGNSDCAPFVLHMSNVNPHKQNFHLYEFWTSRIFRILWATHLVCVCNLGLVYLYTMLSRQRPRLFRSVFEQFFSSSQCFLQQNQLFTTESEQMVIHRIPDCWLLQLSSKTQGFLGKALGQKRELLRQGPQNPRPFPRKHGAKKLLYILY